MVGQNTTIDPCTVSRADIDKNNRVFVPLKDEYYTAFVDGEKSWELRGISPQYNEETIQIGRTVEIRKGYSTGDSKWGVITNYEIFESVADIADTPLFTQILPGVTRDKFIADVTNLVSDYDAYIAFEIGFVE